MGSAALAAALPYPATGRRPEQPARDEEIQKLTIIDPLVSKGAAEHDAEAGK